MCVYYYGENRVMVWESACIYMVVEVLGTSPKDVNYDLDECPTRRYIHLAQLKQTRVSLLWAVHKDKAGLLSISDDKNII